MAVGPSSAGQGESQGHGESFCQPVLASMKTVPLNILVLVQVHMFKHFSLGKYLETKLLGYGVSACSTWQDCTEGFSEAARTPSVKKASSCSSFSSLPWPLCWVHHGISAVTVVFLWLLTRSSGYLQTFWYMCVSSSVRCLFMSFAHFLDTIILLPSVICMSYLHIWN